MIAESALTDKPRTVAVIVTYQPDPEALYPLIESIRTQVDGICLVDNGDGTKLPSFVYDFNIEVICLGENYGIAYAQNVAIHRAEARGCEYILLLDQDSVPAAGMVRQLITALEGLKERGIAVAAVGPSYLDHRQGETAPFVYRQGLKLKRRPRSEQEQTSSADFLIASGSLIPVAVFKRVGHMEEGLFIDYVDIEWGLRAKEKGFGLFGVNDAFMEHSMGDEWIDFNGRGVPVHSPLRHYYAVRNAVWLIRRKWIGWAWRFILALRIFRQFVFFSVFGVKRWHHSKMMLLGIYHGLIGRTGRL